MPAAERWYEASTFLLVYLFLLVKKRVAGKVKIICFLQKESKGVASGHHHLLKKVDENFCLLPKNSAKRALFFWFNLSFRKGRISEVHQWWRQNACCRKMARSEHFSFGLTFSFRKEKVSGQRR